ncbi:MAG TPA: hypothetical protein VF892_13290 [Pseudonocardiaceae bacterium]
MAPTLARTGEGAEAERASARWPADEQEASSSVSVLADPGDLQRGNGETGPESQHQATRTGPRRVVDGAIEHIFGGLTWFGVTYGNVLWFPLMQQEVPADLLGRASAVDWMFSLALAPLGTVAGGALAGLIGVRLTLIIGGVIAVAAGAVLLMPSVTEPDRRTG